MRDTFASYVATKRKSRGLTQKQLAESLGFTPQGISRFESTDSSFDLRLIDKLCQVLDVSFEQLCLRQIEGTRYQEFDLDLEHLSLRIKARREKKGLTQTLLAEQAHITSRSLRSYESGEALLSFQTLTRLAAAMDLSVMDLFALPQESEEPPVPSVPTSHWWNRLSKRALILMTASIVLAAFLGVGIPVGLSLSSQVKNNDLMGANSLALPQDDGGDAPYLPSSSLRQEYPNYLSVDIAKNNFDALGEEIEFVLYDPDANFSFARMDEDKISLSAVPASEGSSLEVEFTAKGAGRYGAKLKNGKTGDLAWINAEIDGRTYVPITYLRYVSGESITPIDGQPFDDGVVVGPESISLSRQTKATSTIYVTEDGNPITFSSPILIDSQSFPAMANYYEQNIEIGCAEGGISLSFLSPQDVVSDDVYVFVGTDVVEGESRRTFYLEPWKLHLYH